jgi:hypothetical protein
MCSQVIAARLSQGGCASPSGAVSSVKGHSRKIFSRKVLYRPAAGNRMNQLTSAVKAEAENASVHPARLRLARILFFPGRASDILFRLSATKYLRIRAADSVLHGVRGPRLP